MNPETPNPVNYNQPAPQPQPMMSPPPAPVNNNYNSASSYGTLAGSKSMFGMISLVAGLIGIVSFAALLGYVLTSSSIWLLLIPALVGLVGAVLGIMSVSDGNSLNKMALIGLVSGMIAFTLGVSWLAGEKIATHKIDSSSGATDNSYNTNTKSSSNSSSGSGSNKGSYTGSSTGSSTGSGAGSTTSQ